MPLLTAREVAERLRICTATVYRLCERGEFGYLSRAKAAKGRRPGAPSPSRPSAPLTPKAAAAPTKPDTPAKSGKDAFLVKDKDSY